MSLAGKLIAFVGKRAAKRFDKACRDPGKMRHGVRWCEGSYGQLLLEEDITEPDVTICPGGMAPALEADGMGVTPVPERLRRYEHERLTVSA